MTMSIKDGGSAFPFETKNGGQFHNSIEQMRGMSLRDYFAGQALIALVPHIRAELIPQTVTEVTSDSAALLRFVAMAYRFADAMLQERAK